MLDRAGQQTKNRTGAGLVPSVLTEQWPWQNPRVNPEKWPQQKIFRHLASRLEVWGITSEDSAADAVNHLATHHWLLMLARRTLEQGEEKLYGKSALTQMNASLVGIKAAWVALGVLPCKKPHLRSADETPPDFS